MHNYSLIIQVPFLLDVLPRTILACFNSSKARFTVASDIPMFLAISSLEQDLLLIINDRTELALVLREFIGSFIGSFFEPITAFVV